MDGPRKAIILTPLTAAISKVLGPDVLDILAPVYRPTPLLETDLVRDKQCADEFAQWIKAESKEDRLLLVREWDAIGCNVIRTGPNNSLLPDKDWVPQARQVFL